MSKERIALFFDGANHSEAASRAGVNINYSKLIENLERTYSVVSARYYSGVSEDEKHKGVRDFLGALARSGMVLVTKPVRVYPDGKVKANVDVEIAVDMMSMTSASRLDRVILFSGDGDFKYLVDAVQRMGVRVTVCSYKQLASTELRDQANEFLDIGELAKSHSY